MSYNERKRNMKAERIKVVYVRIASQPKVITIDNSLETMQKLVDGMIECLEPWSDQVSIICNEEAILEGKSFNRLISSDRWESDFEIGVFGDFLICSFDDEGDFSSLSERQIETYTKMFSYDELRIPKKFETKILSHPVLSKVYAGYVGACTVYDRFLKVRWDDAPGDNMQEIRFLLASVCSQLLSRENMALYFICTGREYTFLLELSDLRPKYSDPFSVKMTYKCQIFETESFKRYMDKSANGIRFITPQYKEEFRIKNGNCVEVIYSNGTRKCFPCYYVDDTHFLIDKSIYHICEFADMIQKIGAVCQPVE